MNDMTRVIAPKSDQLNSDDLIAGPRIITIRDVDIRPGTEQPVSIFFDNDGNKPWKPCKSMSRVLVSVWGPDAKVYVGRSVELYRDPDVTWGGMKVGGIRVSRVSHIDRAVALALTATKGKKAIATIKPLEAQQQTGGDQQQRRQSPADWTGGYIAKIQAASDLDALMQVQSKAGRALEKLATEHPDLHKRATDAGTSRAAELAPHQPEGRDDRDMGEGFTNEGDPFASDIQGDD